MQSDHANSDAVASPIESHLAEFLSNNDDPPQAALIKIKGLLSEPMQELEGKNEEIESLKRALEALQADFNALDQSISEYKPIHSPIRRLPSEILHEIFYYCLATHRNPVLSDTEAPLLLTLVCQPWRSLTLSSPRLWARVHVPVYLPRKHEDNNAWNGWPTMSWESDNEEKVEREDAEKSIRSRLKLLQTWLSRSGTLPLSISFSYDGDNDPVSPGDSLDENPIKQILTAIFSFSSTIADLELVMPFQIYQILLSDIAAADVPMLRKLRVKFSGISIPDLVPASGPISLLQAPKLQSLSIMVVTDILFGSPGDILSLLENLSVLSIHHSVTSVNAVKVLRQCQRLQRCKLTIANNPEEPHLNTEDAIILPHLTSFVLSVSSTTDGMSEIYKQLYTPSLTYFGYQQFVHWNYRRVAWSRMEGSRPSTGVHHLLEKSSSLIKLSIDASIVTPEDILLCLQSSSQVTHFVLGQQFKRLGRPGEYSYWNAGQQNFDLNLLILADGSELDIGVNSKNRELDHAIAYDTLLPKLEVFEGYIMANKTTDEHLKRFILGRLGTTSTRNGVSSLKRVKMTFERASSTDVEADIQRVAKEEGVEIRLDLLYDPPYSTAGDLFYSPWYGLLDQNRSWDILHS